MTFGFDRAYALRAGTCTPCTLPSLVLAALVALPVTPRSASASEATPSLSCQVAGAELVGGSGGSASITRQAPDSTGVRRAALDYIEGFYEGDTAKLVRSVRPDVYKIGFPRSGNATEYRPQQQMTWPQFLEYARSVKASNRPTPATAPKVVELLDVLDQTAAVKVTAWWGTDYLLLGRFEGRWMITQVLWQSPPPG